MKEIWFKSTTYQTKPVWSNIYSVDIVTGDKRESKTLMHY